MWSKLDDQIMRNPKVIATNAESLVLYIGAVTHCSGALTDGFVADAIAGNVALFQTDVAANWQTLIDAGLVERVDGGFEVINYLQYNWTKERADKHRDDGRIRQQNSRARRDAKKRGLSQSTSQRDTSSDSDETFARPVPVPVPEQSPSSSAVPATGKRPQTPQLIEKAALLTDAIAAAKTAANTRVRNPDAYMRRILAGESGHELSRQADELVVKYPTAPESMLVAAAMGEPTPYLKHHQQKENPS